MKNEINIIHNEILSRFSVEITLDDDGNVKKAGNFPTAEAAIEKVQELLDENPDYFYDVDVNNILPSKLDQYDLKHKMTSVQCKIFKSFLHHEEGIDYQNMLVGDHGDEGKELVLFNIQRSDARSIQKLQDEFVKPLKTLSSAVDEIQKLSNKTQSPDIK